MILTQPLAQLSAQLFPKLFAELCVQLSAQLFAQLFAKLSALFSLASLCMKAFVLQLPNVKADSQCWWHHIDHCVRAMAVHRPEQFAL